MNRFVLLACAVPLAACGGGGDHPSTPSTSPGGGVAYWADVAPVLEAKCVKCHQDGGIGPFSLDGYANAREHALEITSVTKTGYMPPYLVAHDGSCGGFEDADTLSAAQIATLQAWGSGDKIEGTKVPITPPRKLGLDGATDFKTPSFSPVAQGGVIAANDDYRCFDVPADGADRFITGYDVLPGNAAIVHHVVAFLVDPAHKTRTGQTNAEIMKALDDQDPDRLGWTCFGMAGDGVDVDAIPAIWAPGQGPTPYPEGIGVQHRRGERLIVQIHYNLADPATRGMMDSTTLRLRYADKVQRRAVFTFSDGLLETLYRQAPAMPDVLPPGRDSFKYTWTRSIGDMGVAGVPYVDLLGVMPHMHQRGQKEEMQIVAPAGDRTCGMRVPQWDFNWQKFYFYKQPVRLTPDTKIELTCDYNTASDAMPVLPGWGTRNEMCPALLMLALPPGI